MIALIAETGSKTIVTSRDKETATSVNKRANKTESFTESPFRFFAVRLKTARIAMRVFSSCT